jgi:hypothetical protein
LGFLQLVLRRLQGNLVVALLERGQNGISPEFELGDPNLRARAFHGVACFFVDRGVFRFSLYYLLLRLRQIRFRFSKVVFLLGRIELKDRVSRVYNLAGPSDKRDHKRICAYHRRA